MKEISIPVKGLVLFCTLLVVGGCQTAPSPSEAATAYEYATKTVYRPDGDEQQYEKAPSGFVPVYVGLLARHGSRALSQMKYDDLTMQVWQAAQGRLTETGKTLGPEVQRLMAANAKLGYGNLSRLGIAEHRQLAERLARRQSALWRAAAQEGRKIAVEHSGKDRAADSAQNFVEGLQEAVPTLSPLIEKAIANPGQLYFHEAKINQPYRTYIKKDPALRAAVNGLMDLPQSHAYARQMLERLYEKDFVDRLARGDFVFVDRDKGKTAVRNEVDAALMLFNLYLIAPGMVHEAGTRPWQFQRYVTPEESAWFSYVLDGEDFYEKGPGFDDDSLTWSIAKVLEGDFFNEVEGLRQGNTQRAAKLRFAHAETVIPLAAAMKLPGSDKGASRTELYSRANNPWRGEKVAPYAANMQWDVYRNEKGVLLVTMFYNEKQSPFRDDCRPIRPGSLFYDFNELKRCHGYDGG